MMNRKRILVVEDDGAVREMIAAFLSNAGYDVQTAADGFAMQQVLESAPVDLLLLDLGLPDCDGLEVARALRARSKLGIIMVTSRDEPDARADGLETGADDYITKPFFPRELLARVRNVLDRAGGGNLDMVAAQTAVFGGWIMDRPNRRVVSEDGRAAALTGAEFDLLAALVDQPGVLLTREALAAAVAEKKPGAGPRAIDILVSRLRRKLDDDGTLIETCRGHGYRFAGVVARGG
ncbi:two component transcriptional regulator, winged helix family [Caenispirillum salinarum AK4]|uniref:Two component transcriptional regulator, winged helix family n=1 Tax=Caenispirillum salinarum AK4 TaxID=1238182 RepID=K9GQQ0_9PROT|nr:response regulator transcription factor [Caenispirillum salinarum]EKV27497.1 two component transcriptional regulator, winged helix family [Caenispirillum salinarum AK4]